MTLRILIIDMTRFGGGTATGEIKSIYFGNGKEAELLHLYAGRPGEVAVVKPNAGRQAAPTVFPCSNEGLDQACRDFAPDLILYRPVGDRPDFHLVAMRLLRELGKPWVIWLMDDWLARLGATNPSLFRAMDRDIRELLRGAKERFAISEAMAEAFRDRYNCIFKVYRNGVSPGQWVSLRRRKDQSGPVRIRYAGALAQDTTRESVFQVARTIDGLGGRYPISFEIRTQRNWFDSEHARYVGLTNVSFEVSDLETSAYRQWLVDADILLLAYNFDPETIRYLRYSFANKLPEYLASGAPVLAYGPPELATIRFLRQNDAALIVDRNDVDELRIALEVLIQDAERRTSLAEAARRTAFSTLNIDRQREQFFCDLRRSAFSNGIGTVPFARDSSTQIDECQIVHHIKARESSGGVMVDVGAHFGGSLARFADSGWTIYAFEPDPSNRAKLLARVRGRSNVIVSDEAVADTSGELLPFYASDESSGISGLSAFRTSHREVAHVRTVTLNDVIARHNLTEIDFLKVDVEGFELSVLRGLDLEKFRPDVVLAEFEDSKTRPQGHTSHDLCRYLTKHGYIVYVSEWHPVERYGIKHSFRRFGRYPTEIPEASWGNLLAFRHNPDVVALKAAVRAAIDRPVRFLDEPDSAATACPDPAVARRLTARAVVLGNGPSLRDFDLTRLSGVASFGMNAAYRHWDRIGWYPTYYSCLDEVLGLSHEPEIRRLIENRTKYGIQKFLLRRNLIARLGDLAKSEAVVDLDSLRESSKRFAREPLTTGSHTLIWAAELGHREIVLLGVDGHYVEIVPGAARRAGHELEIVQQKENPNYFFSDYQKVGDRYQTPNVSPGAHRSSWYNAANAVAELGAMVLNGNPNSEVDAFSFCRPEDALARGVLKPLLPEELEALRSRRPLTRTVALGASQPAMPVPSPTTSRPDIQPRSVPPPEGIAPIPARAPQRSMTTVAYLAAASALAGVVALVVLTEAGPAGLAVVLAGPVTALCLALIAILVGRRWIRELLASEESLWGQIRRLQTAQQEMAAADRLAAAQLEASLSKVARRLASGMRDTEAARRADRTAFTKAMAKRDAELNSRISQHSQELKQLVTMARKNEAEVSQLDKQVADVNHRLIKMDAEGERRQAQAAILLNEIARELHDRIDTGFAQVTHIKDVTEDLRTRAGVASGQVDQLRHSAEKLEARMDAGFMQVDQIKNIATGLESYLAAGLEKTQQQLGAVLVAGQQQQQELSAQLEHARTELQEQLEASLSASTTQLWSATKDGLEGISARVSSVSSDQEKIRDQLTKTEARVQAASRTLTRMNAANSGQARPHDRMLSQASIARIAKHWMPILGQSAPASAVAYLAHQICLAEDRCIGRFATTIHAALLRILALRSLGPRPMVDVLEIGTLFGIGAGLLHHLRGPDIERARLTLIDPLNGYYGQGELDPTTGMSVDIHTVQSNLARLEVPTEDYRIFQGHSEKPAIRKKAADRQYDVLLIDGDHSADGVRRDFKFYAPMVRAGGIVLFDDYQAPEWPDVTTAVDEIVSKAKGWIWVGGEWRTGILRKE